MAYIWIVSGLIFVIVLSAFAGLTVMLLLLNQWAYALVLFLIILLCVPQITSLIRHNLFDL
jgi:hypothetical protein